jgi:hypothetical protein
METYTIGMMFITWMIIVFMATGILTIQISKYQVKREDIDDMERLLSETFLQMYYDNNFAGRVNFVILHGARFWAIVFFGLKDINK